MSVCSLQGQYKGSKCSAGSSISSHINICLNLKLTFSIVVVCHIDIDSNDKETKTTSKSANHQSTAEHLNNTETCSSENC